MAYSTSNPPNMIAQSVGASPALWVYASADAHGDVDAANYFTNGQALGMRVNDVVVVVDTGTSATLHTVTAVTASGATVSAAVVGGA